MAHTDFGDVLHIIVSEDWTPLDTSVISMWTLSTTAP